MNITKIFLLVSILMVFFTNCKSVQNANNKQKGAVIGTAGGAIIGAIIGNNVGKGGNGELGAVIGGVVGGTAGVLIGNRMDKQAQKIEEEIPGAKVERLDDAILVTFDENSGVYFDTNKFNVNAASRNSLDKLVNIFNEYPNTDILVVGHTDSSGDAAYNMELSKNRAYAVVNYLESNGLRSSRFKTNWFGETQPKYDNSTASGRAKNRRVNIAILPNEQMVQQAQNDVATEK